jgi:hypothetical protein
MEGLLLRMYCGMDSAFLAFWRLGYCICIRGYVLLVLCYYCLVNDTLLPWIQLAWYCHELCIKPL